MKGISKEDKNLFIDQVATVLSTPNGRSNFLSLGGYNDAKKFVRNIDPSHCGKLVENGQHFLNIMTRALAAVNDDDLTRRWEGLQAEHRASKGR
mmetsp:Transcript_29461/g.71156  ORF Transcript_29461/g.71156 Transcript_29461/m.71156 type:complete len:94 (+) Transcript_29461:87-368(+)